MFRQQERERERERERGGIHATDSNSMLQRMDGSRSRSVLIPIDTG